MIYQRVIPLTVAQSDFRIDLGAAAWIRFHVVDSPFTVKLDTPTGIAINFSAPASCDTCNRTPINSIYLTNAAGSGNLVLLWSDGKEALRDFLAPSALAVGASASAPVLTESTTVENWIHGPSTNMQNVMFGADGGTYQAYNGGVAGQNIDLTQFIHGGKTADVLASNLALMGGRALWGAGISRSVGGLSLLTNRLNSSNPPVARNALAMARGGFWYFETDVLLPTPTVAVAGSIICSVGIGMDFSKAGTIAANGVAGLFGCAMCWSNQFANNNWHLVAVDSTGVFVAGPLDTGVNAAGAHSLCRLEWGWDGGKVVVRARINDVVRQEISTGSKALSTNISGTFLDNVAGVVAGKIQVNQNGNHVECWSGGYAGARAGRMTP